MTAPAFASPRTSSSRPNPANDAFYRGWVIRAKYAYLQYDYLKSTSWNAVARAGLIHNVVIDHVEQFWPRWISQTPVERAGFFSSSDAGVGTLVTLPNKFGEFYATIVNGPGYTSREDGSVQGLLGASYAHAAVGIEQQGDQDIRVDRLDIHRRDREHVRGRRGRPSRTGGIFASADEGRCLRRRA